MSETISYVVLLLLAAMVMFLLEILTPTFGVLAVMGIAALGVAVWFAFTISPGTGLVVIVGILVGMPIYLVFMVRYLPRLPLTRKLFLDRVTGVAGTGTPKAARYESLVGKTGEAETQLRPAGAIRIEGQRIQATAESGIIEAGQAVRVIKAIGMNVVVRQVETDANTERASQ
jgi:membrane-bound serine protease (ClpP class)